MRYAVNPDEVRKLAGGLADLATGLGSTHSLDRSSTLALGSGAVARALDQVSGNWSQARRRLRSDAEHLARALGAASASYAVVDDSPLAEVSTGVGR
jgi:hypothetical protein